MKHLPRIALLSSLLLGACVEPDDALDTDSAAILEGDPKPAQTIGVGLARNAAGTPICSVTMIGNSVGLTTPACAVDIRTVEVGTASSTARVLRVLRHTSEADETEIAVVQLRKPLPLGPNASTKGFTRDAHGNQLGEGNGVICYGYRGTRLYSGRFELGDGSTATRYNLFGLENIANNLGTYAVARLDLGGFCERDGGEIAAILTRESINGLAQGVPVYDVAQSIVDMRYAAHAADQGVAVLLRDHDLQRLPDSIAGATSVHARPASADQRSQAYYLDDVTNPPGGGFDWYRFVDVRSGRCLTADLAGKLLRQQSCDPSLREQMFYLDYTQIDGAGRYILRAPGGTVVDADPNGNPGDMASLARDDGSGSQRFEMWLTRW